mgnify:CR=1 FL=1
MSMSRKDSKGRVLRKGESQRKNDGRYIYQYTDSTGKRRVVYSNDLLELREKEKELVRNQLDGLESYCSGKTTLNYAFDRYISTKYDLKEHTRVNYKYMYNRFVRDTFGKRIINDTLAAGVVGVCLDDRPAVLWQRHPDLGARLTPVVLRGAAAQGLRRDRDGQRHSGIPGRN